MGLDGKEIHETELIKVMFQKKTR